MKRIIILMLVAVTASFSTLVFAGTPVKQSELPKAAQTFLSKHFPGDNVRKAEKDQGRRGAEYEVDLVSGAEVEFRENGDWKEVKAAKGQAVPAAIIPSAISKLTASMIGYIIIITLEQIPCPCAFTGQPYVQVYLSPISSPFRQNLSVSSLSLLNPITSISHSYSSSYHFFKSVSS